MHRRCARRTSSWSTSSRSKKRKKGEAVEGAEQRDVLGGGEGSSSSSSGGGVGMDVDMDIEMAHIRSDRIRDSEMVRSPLSVTMHSNNEDQCPYTYALEPSAQNLPGNRNRNTTHPGATTTSTNTYTTSTTNAHTTTAPAGAEVETFTPEQRSLYSIWGELLHSPTFWRFSVLTLFLINLNTIFRHLDATLPTYLIRCFGANYPKGAIYSIHP
eukprot:GDKK01049187.1.p1 GENE.GDKK01049187.1~~GDKK01049187.1.p1  ORF type:complete len:213 (+),score=6.15 GDKK01049187.1:178-816(+)